MRYSALKSEHLQSWTGSGRFARVFWGRFILAVYSGAPVRAEVGMIDKALHELHLIHKYMESLTVPRQLSIGRRSLSLTRDYNSWV